MSRASSARSAAELVSRRGRVRDNGRVSPDVDQQQAVNARPRRVGLFATIAVLVLVLDVVSKALVAAQLGDGHHVRLLGGAIYLDEARNSGAAFSLGTGFTIALTLVAVAVVAVIVRTASRMRSAAWAVALGLVLGGAMGNWISLFGPDGVHWPIFNVADSAIVCGAILAALTSMRGINLDGTRQTSE
jgi:signal peptidase II